MKEDERPLSLSPVSVWNANRGLALRYTETGPINLNRNRFQEVETQIYLLRFDFLLKSFSK